MSLFTSLEKGRSTYSKLTQSTLWGNKPFGSITRRLTKRVLTYSKKVVKRIQELVCSNELIFTNPKTKTRMKTILASFVSFVLFLLGVTAQVPGQPECLGLTLSQSYWQYATLFEPSGRYYFTCTHWHPADGATLTFGNGETAVVKTTHDIRGGYYGGFQYDLAIGELETPVSAKPAGVRWSDRFVTIDQNTTLNGFGLDGWFVGTDVSLVSGSPTEIHNGLWFTAPPNTIRPGYSGSPIFYKGDLVGINWGAWSRDDGQSGGVVTMISMVLSQFWELFPSFLHPPIVPSLAIAKVGDVIRLTLRTPVGMDNMQVLASPDPARIPWYPADRLHGFAGYVPATQGPWETVLKWDTRSAPRMFFRGDDSWAAD